MSSKQVEKTEKSPLEIAPLIKGKELTLQFPPYHERQKEIVTHPSKFKVIVTGRRFGKTFLIIRHIVEQAIKTPNGNFWYVANTYKQAKNVSWRMLLTLVKPLVDIGLIAKIHNTELYVDFNQLDGSKTRLSIKGVDKADSLRGEGLQGVACDEYQDWNPQIYQKVISPMLSDTDGWAWFTGCIHKDSLILSKNGLEEIGVTALGYTNIKKDVYGLGGFHAAEQRFGNPKLKTIKIKSKFGFELEGTPNHKILTPSGWIRLDEVDRGTPLYLQHNQNIFGDVDEDKDFAYFLGLYLAEGTIEHSSYRVTITNTDKQIVDWLQKTYGFKTYDGIHHRLGSKKFLEKLYRYFEHRIAPNKILTPQILTLNKSSLRQVLSGYFDGDGFADSKRPRVGCVSSSEKLIQQLQVLLLSFGILSKRSSYLTPPTKKVKVSSLGHRLVMENYGAWKFYTDIGFRLTRKQKNKEFCSDKNTYKTWFDRKDWGTLNSKYGYLGREKKIELFTLQELLRKFQPTKEYHQDLLADEVTLVEESENETFDFVIPDTKQYFSNGFISHNTPKGFNHFFELYQKAKKLDDWNSFRFTSYDNPHISHKKLDEDKKLINEVAFAQEYLAEFKKRTGLVYPEFNRDKHLFDKLPQGLVFNEVISGVDFGYRNPSVILVIGITGNTFWVLDEWYQTAKVTRDIIQAHGVFSDKYRINYCYPDAAEPDRIEEMRIAGINCGESNKELEAGIDTVRNYFKQNRIMISRNCPNLINELEIYAYPEKDFEDSFAGDKLTSDEKNPTERPIKANDHATDALRYPIHSHSPQQHSLGDIGYVEKIRGKKQSAYE